VRPREANGENDGGSPTPGDPALVRASLCSLISSDDLHLLYRVKHALEARGMEAFVMDDLSTIADPGEPMTPRLLVRGRDLVYARWVAYAVGVDAWPDDPGEPEICLPLCADADHDRR
jgi:hypothetical protein